ncbi:MAG: 4Fe-4S dicluster domain-containing protein [Candidatus Omnitrophota bacterium]
MHNFYYLESAGINELLTRLKNDHAIFFPVVRPANFTKETDYSYQNFSDNRQFIFNPYRVIEPLKSFLTPAMEKTADYFSPQKEAVDPGKTIIFGAKNCDIASLKIQDFVFMEGVEVDYSYRVKRENTIIVSSDCTEYKEVCFCLALDILPYPTQGFDINLSPVSDGYLVEAGSEKGKNFIRQFRDYFSEAKDAQVWARKTKREDIVQRLKRHLLPQNIPAKDSLQRLVKDGYGLDTWKQFMLTCVECGGCNFVCNTCHCFLLADKSEDGRNKRLKAWDSCQYANYATVAGGANPLKLRHERLRFRFTKKFDFFMENLGMPACCGCGRCIEVCPGKIDLREVWKDLEQKLKK